MDMNRKSASKSNSKFEVMSGPVNCTQRKHTQSRNRLRPGLGTYLCACGGIVSSYHRNPSELPPVISESQCILLTLSAPTSDVYNENENKDEDEREDNVVLELVTLYG